MGAAPSSVDYALNLIGFKLAMHPFMQTIALVGGVIAVYMVLKGRPTAHERTATPN